MDSHVISWAFPTACILGGIFSLLEDALHRCSHTIPRPSLTVIYVLLDFRHFMFAVFLFFSVEVSFLFLFCDFFIFPEA